MANRSNQRGDDRFSHGGERAPTNQSNGSANNQHDGQQATTQEPIETCGVNQGADPSTDNSTSNTEVLSTTTGLLTATEGQLITASLIKKPAESATLQGVVRQRRVGRRHDHVPSKVFFLKLPVVTTVAIGPPALPPV